MSFFFVIYVPYIHPLVHSLVQYSDYIAKMASFTMTASILGSPAVTNRSAVATQRRSLVVNAAKAVEAEKVSYDNDMDGSNGRRNLMFAAAAAAAVCSVAGMAVADEPKPGTPEAKKKYAPICVTMPTARICRNWGTRFLFYFWWSEMCIRVVVMFWFHMILTVLDVHKTIDFALSIWCRQFMFIKLDVHKIITWGGDN